MAKNATGKIVAKVCDGGRGKAFTPKDFLELTSHETARQALARLAKEGTIRRVMRGVYDYPRYSSFLNAPSPADPDAIAHAIARNHGWSIVPTGDTALNLLGVSTHVPAQWVYLSDGPAKQYEWEGGKITFKHRTNKETSRLSPKTALVVQALKRLGKERVDESVVHALRSKLDAKDRARAAREARYATSWVYEVIRQLAEGKAPDA